MKLPEFSRKHKVMVNRFFIFLLCIVALNACNKDDSGVALTSTASVSVYALVPDAPQMNFFLNGTNIATSVPFGSFTLYNHIAAGDFRLKAQTISLNTVIDTGFSVSANQYYSLFLTDSFAKIKPVFIPDNLGSPDSGKTNFRFFVFSPGVSNIDFHVVKDSLPVYTWQNRSFTDNIISDTINTFTKLNAGTYSFYVIQSNTKDTLARFKNRTFSDSSYYTIMLEGIYNKSAHDTANLQLGLRLHK